MAEDEYAGADISEHDRAMVQAFTELLRDPRSRCILCLADDHVLYSQCPEVTDSERRRIGVMVLDRNRARQVEAMLRKKARRDREVRLARATLTKPRGEYL